MNGHNGWQPTQSQGGTEIAFAELQERVPELDLVNFRIAVFDPVSLVTTKPLVVWVQHDINQRCMTWIQDDPERVRLVDAFVFVSEWQRQRYLAEFRLDPAKCYMLPNAKDIPPQRPWKPDSDMLQVAYATTPFRGLDVLLDGWELVSPQNATLHIWSSIKLYGPNADDTPYEHLYERARAMPNVVYHGIAPNAELRAALQDIDFYVYPSTFAETSCMSVIEAMAADCRVVCSDLGALPETTAGYARMYPFISDKDVHADRFARVLAEELEAPWDGSTAQKLYCVDAYSWERRAPQWSKLLDDLSGAKPQTAPKKIGLCMLAKNEAKSILRALESARSLIDCVLVDIGDSTDETAMIVRDFCDREKLPFEIHTSEWKGFGENRSALLARMREDWLINYHSRVDYCLMLDADDVIECDKGFDATRFKRQLSADAYDIEFSDAGVRYWRPQISRNEKVFTYRGVAHEFLERPEGATHGLARGLRIVRTHDGARASDPEKYRKTAAMIVDALSTERDAGMAARYQFYLAESWRDCGEIEKAIATFLYRATLGYWQEEVYWSLYQAARLQERLERPFDEVLAIYLRAILAVATRAEAYHGASRLCRNNKQFVLGYALAIAGLTIHEPDSALFSETWVYRWSLLDEFSILAYYAGKPAESLAAADRLLTEGHLPASEVERVRKNREFAAVKV